MGRAWCIVCLAATALATSPTIDETACSPPGTVECTLRTAGVRDPALLAGSLLRAELRSIGDVVELDGAEAAELFDELRAKAVPLGDRSRLRKAARLSDGRAQMGTFGLTADQSLVGPEKRAAPRRQLQSGDGGFSIEVAAIVVTGLIGMVGYVVQARSAQAQSQSQAELEREASEREKGRARASKQV
jgi:hypothetical protein